MSEAIGPAPPRARPDQVVERGPYRVRSEERWDVRLGDGRRAVLAQLLPEVAADESLRRRYVYEAERLMALDAPHLAPTLAIGPDPDPRDPTAASPWRLRAAPEGQPLDAWLRGRAPAPVDEALALVAAIADSIHEVHVAGAVLRDLEPRSIVLADDGQVWLTDIGLARVDILSTRTASSLILEGSPYAAPEHLRATVVDSRADIYTLGVILWQALTGALPFGDGPALLREHHQLPPLAQLCASPPAQLDDLVRRCLAESPELRPASAREVGRVLRGDEVTSVGTLERIVCQACGAQLRPGLRLCLSCGKVATRFHHAGEESRQRYSIYLGKAKETEEYVMALRRHFDAVAEAQPKNLNFLIGDGRMYSKEEREARVALPARLFGGLSKETARDLEKRIEKDGFYLTLRRDPDFAAMGRNGKLTQVAGAVAMMGGIALAVTIAGPGAIALGCIGATGGLIALIVGGVRRSQATKGAPEPLAQLREAPAALPASDPLVARLATQLQATDDRALREQIGEFALLVQRLCDHRAALAGQGGAEQAEHDLLEMVTKPLAPVVAQIEKQAVALRAIEAELAGLEEGALVRAIAASEARNDPRHEREALMIGLDRLRALEDERAIGMQRMLEAGSLLRRVVEMGLRVEDPQRVADNYTRMALAALGGNEGDEADTADDADS